MRTGTDPTDAVSQAFMMIDSAQRVLEMFPDQLESGTVINAWYPVIDNPNGDECDSGLAWSRTDFCLPAGAGSEGDRAAHEAGHVAHMHAFHQDYLQDVIYGGGWNMSNSANEGESGAMTEGFAAYVGAAAWYNPDATTVTPLYAGVNIETPVSTTYALCADHRLRPVNVAKAFWDWDDAVNEPGTVFPDASDDDACNNTTPGMLAAFEFFLDGTADRRDFETGDNGVNAWDYWQYADIVSACDPEVTFVNHNCLQGSELN